MPKFAFIDLNNTEGTTEKLHGFSVDWIKTFKFLKESWKCDKVFVYLGIDVGDSSRTRMVDDLEKEGCVVRAQPVFSYKNKDKKLEVRCPSCGGTFIEEINTGFNRKSNCDVDLTVDAMELAGTETKFYIFTGDGDFASLVRNAVEKGTQVSIVSSAKKIKTAPRYFTSRYSTRLRSLFREFPKQLSFVEINNIKNKISK